MNLFARAWAAASTAKRVFFAHASFPEGGRGTVVDPMTGPPRPGSIRPDAQERGNTFTTYSNQVEQIYRLYDNQEIFGCGTTKTIINWRATMIAGNGPNFTSEHEPTRKFIQEWAKDNGLSGPTFWNWARDGELEGKALMHNVKRDDKIVARMIPWHRWRYNVVGRNGDPGDPESVSFEDARGEMATLKEGKFVYAKLGGVTAVGRGAQGGVPAYVLNETTPTIANSLWMIINLERALADMRGNNHIFAAPVRTLKAANETEAGFLRALFRGKAARGSRNREREIMPGEEIISSAQVGYAEPSGRGFDSLKGEIVLIAQLLSGQVGIPVHFLGFPDLMSNRATAESMLEMVNAATVAQREVWRVALENLASQAAIMDGGKYELDTIEVTLPVVTLSQVAQIVTVWLPLFDAKVVDRQTLLEKIPGIDPELVMERLEEEKKQGLQTADAMAEQIMDRMNRNQPPPGDGDPPPGGPAET